MPKSLSTLPFATQLGVAAPLSPTAALAPPSERTWPNAAHDVLNQRARGFGLVNAPDMQRYLNGLYARIKTQAGVSDWPGEVHVLASDSLQAFATGAGNLYVSMSWLISIQSEDEIVALLSHEFGHVYLHYHQLEGAVADADTATGWLAMGVAVAKKTAQATGWTDVDTLTTAYALGRGLVTTVYARSQERAADNFGLNISLKLGYSYEHGMKAFLERMASWEEMNERREKDQQEKILLAVREQALISNAESSKTANNSLSQTLSKSTGELGANVNSALQQIIFDFNNAASKMRSDHPPIVERIDDLALSMASSSDSQTQKEPVTLPLETARRAKHTAALIASYTLAFKAIGNPKDPLSPDLAHRSVSGVTATHAVPLFALYIVSNSQAPTKGKQKIDHGKIFEANFNSEPDRAWKIYQERSLRLKEERQPSAAKKVMEQGLSYFQNAEEAWLDGIRFYGETQGWEDAKRMAQICKNKFRRVALRCTQAAISPVELANAERKDKERADQIVNKLFKKR